MKKIKVYVVIGYDSMFDGEKIDSIWSVKESAEIRLKSFRLMRIEEHDICDMVFKD